VVPGKKLIVVLSGGQKGEAHSGRLSGLYTVKELYNRLLVEFPDLTFRLNNAKCADYVVIPNRATAPKTTTDPSGARVLHMDQFLKRFGRPELIRELGTTPSLSVGNRT
jgi:hypothetical protein